MAIEDHTALEMFRNIAGEFSGESDSFVEFYFDLAANSMSAQVFGDRYRQALVYLAAHLMSLDKRAESAGGGGGAVGPVTGERAGEVSRNYGFSGGSSGNSAADGTYGSTVYGQRFLALRRAAVGTKPLSTQQVDTWPTFES